MPPLAKHVDRYRLRRKLLIAHQAQALAGPHKPRPGTEVPAASR